MSKTTIYTKGFYNILGIFALIFTIIIAIYMIQFKSWIGSFIVVSLGIINLRYWLFSPQSVVLEGDTIKEIYFFSKRTFKAHDIETININRRVLNFGKGPRAHSYVDIQTKNGYVISIEYFADQSPDIYEILQGWHRKHAAIGQTNQRN
jgi:hypothetical protein